jgi:ketosteroid isomerase-like protein
VVAPPPPRETPAAPPQPSDRDQIANTLSAYAAAYRRMDVDAVSRIHPTIDRGLLREGFSNLKSQTVDIPPGQVTINGNRATVVTTVHTHAEPNKGGGKAQDSNVRTEFELQKQASGWIITQRKALR